MSKRAKYKYNPETLQYEKIELNLNALIVKAVKYLVVGLIFAAFIMLLLYPFVKDFAVRKSQKKIEDLEYSLEKLNGEMDTVIAVLDNLQQIDNDLYRVIFSAEPTEKAKLTRGQKIPKKDHIAYVYALEDKLNVLSHQLVKQSKSFDELIELAKNKDKMIKSIPSIIPIADKQLTRLSSGFGYRIDPVYGIPKMHAGLDFTAPTGTPIHCAGDGVVEEVGFNKGGYGNEVIIDHGFGYKSHYAHLSKFNTSVGRKVKRGEVIGFVGSTGKSTAPHLHYEIIKSGNKIDPINFFFNDITPEEYEQMIEKSLNSGASLD